MMMDDDNDRGTGISGAAGYLLGYMAAECDQASARLSIAKLAQHQNGERPPYDADDVETAIATWKSAVARRNATIAQLQAQLNDASSDQDALRQRNATLASDNQALRKQIAKHEHDIALMQGGVARLLDAHKVEIARLQAEVARLKGGS